MGVTYRTMHFCSPDREKVSNQWYVLLYNIGVRAHERFVVTEGHRTKKRQQELLDEKGLWTPRNPTGAAAVSNTAPHIRTGRPDHAIDVGINADGLIRAAARRGVRITRPIRTERWHLEANAHDLARYWEEKHKAQAAHQKRYHPRWK